MGEPTSSSYEIDIVRKRRRYSPVAGSSRRSTLEWREAIPIVVSRRHGKGSHRKVFAVSYDKLDKTLEAVIQMVALTVEMKDPYTAGHQHRVSILASAIAAEMNLSQEMIEGIRVVGAIHDIGKICVPAEILSKPGRITEAEFSIIKEHPKTGYDILKGIDFPWPVAQAVLQHHERMNGSGYPNRLSGESISWKRESSLYLMLSKRWLLTGLIVRRLG